MRVDRATWALAAAGLVGLTVSFATRPMAARSAAAEVWPAFVLVAGLLVIGLVADDDGLFAAAGGQLARTASSSIAVFLGMVVMVTVVTVVLNLDTSVAFLTPVLVHCARRRGDEDGALLYGCLLLSNAASLFLPGSNLTNLIVLGHLHVSGTAYLARMWAPATAAVVATTGVMVAIERRTIRRRAPAPTSASPERAVVGVGAVAVVVAASMVLLLRAPALPVAGTAVVAVVLRRRRSRVGADRVVDVLGVPVLAGLFGVAVSLGTVGRVWSGPQTLLAHVDLWGTAVVGAFGAVTVNNLPAASLLAARPPTHPLALLIGLNLGPNLFVTGSLAWVLWLRTARRAGARPSVGRATRLGVVVVPFSMVAALGALILAGGR